MGSRSTNQEGTQPSSNRGVRTARLGRVAVGAAARWTGDRLDTRGTPEEQRRRRGDRIVATIDALVGQLAVMRGAAMKAGQVLSTVEFPGLEEDQSAYLQRRLASLRDNAPAVGWKQMRKVLVSDWGERPERILAHIDTEPAASASIGQVYRGRTVDGQEVAIKVQYPGIAESVEADMRNLVLLTPLLRQLMPGLEVKELLAELRERIVEECDYELEASSHLQIERFWREHPFVVVPRVHTDLSQRRVLVTDWIEGIAFDEVTRQTDAVRDRYAQIVYRFFYETAANLGLALGDPHPGNYLLTTDGRVAFFDFGMVHRLSDGYISREAVIARALREGDAATLINGMNELGYLPGALDRWDGELLLEYMRGVSWWLRADGSLRLAPDDIWRGADVFHEDDSRGHIAQLRRMRLPPEALLLRRMEGLLFQTAATLRASAPWGELLRELTDDGDPVGELGAQHAEWLSRRHHRLTGSRAAGG
jgi:predicted unusual protein kinase regulating ubiquinone biosynthesis (AarF/ABC1/UbiB family)